MKYLRVLAVAMIALLAFSTADAQVRHKMRSRHHLRLMKHHGHRTVHHR